MLAPRTTARSPSTGMANPRTSPSPVRHGRPKPAIRRYQQINGEFREFADGTSPCPCGPADKTEAADATDEYVQLGPHRSSSSWKAQCFEPVISRITGGGSVSAHLYDAGVVRRSQAVA